MKHLILVAALGSIGSLSAIAGTLYPSIYYSPVINKKTMQCEESKVHQVLDKNHNIIETLCHQEYKQCEFQGSCIVLDGEKSKTLNFINYDEETEQTAFALVDNRICRYGLGKKNICLDPFYSVAADLTQHKLGDVLFIPKIKGTLLPNGKIHNGFVIVRDSNQFLPRAGAGNLVFFTGNFSYEDIENPFVKLGLSNLDNISTFRKATKLESIKVRKQRNYPKLNNEE